MTKVEEYTRVLRSQNEGFACPYCTSTSGHYSNCALLAPGVPEKDLLSHLDDEAFLKFCGIQTKENQ